VRAATHEAERAGATGDTPLARCTGDPAGFLERTWARRASVFTGTGHDGFADLLSLQDVDRILSTTSLRTPSFRLVRAGDPIPESAYTRSGRTGSKPVSGMADPARIFELFGAGATIVLQGLHRYWEPVARFTRALELELGHPCQVNAYITPPAAQGLALHEDPHDVFVLQAFGRKRWEVHAAPLEAERPPLEAEVAPGDCVYMPKGTPHAASTQDVLSGHLTVGVHVTTWREVVRDVVETALKDEAFDDAVPAGWTRAPLDFARLMEPTLAALRTSLQDLDGRAVAQERAERFLSTRPSLLGGGLLDRVRLSELDDTTQLVRRPGAICELRAREDGLVALLGDRRLDLPAWLEPAMRRIAATDSVFTVSDLRAEIADASSRVVLCRRLVREGLLQIRSEP
jgi:bifunctional lysine-specific demethylase and histidyl-hydroxylase NO66